MLLNSKENNIKIADTIQTNGGSELANYLRIIFFAYRTVYIPISGWAY
jgi:hypothetical protein